MDNKTRELLKNTLIAQAIGDAFGYIVEFKDWKTIKNFYGDEGLKYNPEKLEMVISDDTQMTLFCLNGINEAKINAFSKDLQLEDPTEEIYKNYLNWYKTQINHFEKKEVNPFRMQNYDLMNCKELYYRRAPGNTCMTALGSRHKGTMKNKINDSKGCGGIMRAIPVSFYATSSKEAFFWGSSQAAITHGHPSGYLSAGFYAAVAFELIHNTSNILEAINKSEHLLQEYEGHEEMLDTINKTVWNIKNNEGLITESLTKELGLGWVGEEAFAVAAYCAATSLTFNEVIEKASNHSGDSDSTAMLAAGLWYLSTKDDSFVKDIKYLDVQDCIKHLLTLIK